MKKLKIFFCLGAILTLFVCYQTSKQALARRNYKQELLYSSIRSQLIAIDGAIPLCLTTADGISLDGLYIKRCQAKRKFLVVHGYRQAKELYAQLINLFPEDTFLLIDVRGHGKSNGQIITYGYFESLDVAAGYSFLKNERPDLPIIGVGFSMGAAAIAKAAYEGVEFDALVLDSSYCNLQVQIDRSFTRMTGLPNRCNFLANLLYRIVTGSNLSSLDVGGLLKNATMPILVIHGKNDSFTPVEDANAIAANLQSKKGQIEIMPLGKHARLMHEDPIGYKKIVDDFFLYARI